jgi:DNA-directed RNA polymerase subunit alpha
MTEEQRQLSKAREEGYTLGVKNTLKEPDVKSSDPEILKESISIVVLGSNLTMKFQQMCKEKNINTIQELINHSDAELMRAKNFGRKSLIGLEKWLSGRGLKLKKSLS